MLNQESIVDITSTRCSIRSISRQLGGSRNTVRRYLRDVAKLPRYGPHEASPSKLDLFKPYLQERVEAAKPYCIPTTVLFRELQMQGHDGKEGIIKNYIHQFKPTKQDPVVRFETALGEQLQVDFTTKIS